MAARESDLAADADDPIPYLPVHGCLVVAQVAPLINA